MKMKTLIKKLWTNFEFKVENLKISSSLCSNVIFLVWLCGLLYFKLWCNSSTLSLFLLRIHYLPTDHLVSHSLHSLSHQAVNFMWAECRLQLFTNVSLAYFSAWHRVGSWISCAQILWNYFQQILATCITKQLNNEFSKRGKFERYVSICSPTPYSISP